MEEECDLLELYSTCGQVSTAKIPLRINGIFAE